MIPSGLDYPTPPSGELAARVSALLGAGNLPQRAGRPGFDHTTWMPLACLFPRAEAPVLEISYPYVGDQQLFELGGKLAPLREEGILFVASGGMTHNLASVELGSSNTEVPSFSREFDAWASERLLALDADTLIDWRHKAPAESLAHPDDGGHYRVLLVALGAALGARGAAPNVQFPVTGFESTLSRRSVQLG